ncbi:MAG: ArnT family glycosyltransferase, partial [Thermomicrobiales bacterium]
MLRIGPVELQFGGVLFLILIVAGILRFAGISWGASYYLHPDERYMTMVTTAISWPHSLSEYFDSATSPLNPYNNGQGNYLYGTFPLFLTKFVGLLTGNTVYGNAHLPGRWVSAVSDLGTVAMAAWAAKMLANRLAGIFTALLLTFTALMIQTAHYATVDSIALFFATATFTLCLYASRRRRFGWFVGAGMMLGLAVASKPNAVITLGFLALPALEEIRLRGWQSLMPRPSRMFRSPRPAHAFPIVLATVLALIVAMFTFRFTQPYAFAGPSPWSFRLDPRWTSALTYWSQVQSGKLDYPPGIQWANRTPIVFAIDNMVRWSMFPAFGITALVVLGTGVYRILFSRRWPSWWLLGIVGWCGFHIL